MSNTAFEVEEKQPNAIFPTQSKFALTRESLMSLNRPHGLTK